MVSEIGRALKPNGVHYVDTLFRQQVHEGGYDFSRLTLVGHRWLFRDFEEVEAGLVSGAGVALIWAIAKFFHSLGLSKKAVALLTAPLFWLRFLDRWTIQSLALDAAGDLYVLRGKSALYLKARDLDSYCRSHR